VQQPCLSSIHLFGEVGIGSAIGGQLVGANGSFPRGSALGANHEVCAGVRRRVGGRRSQRASAGQGGGCCRGRHRSRTLCGWDAPRSRDYHPPKNSGVARTLAGDGSVSKPPAAARAILTPAVSVAYVLLRIGAPVARLAAIAPQKRTAQFGEHACIASSPLSPSASGANWSDFFGDQCCKILAGRNTAQHWQRSKELPSSRVTSPGHVDHGLLSDSRDSHITSSKLPV
jgi:hypothetical protein